MVEAKVIGDYGKLDMQDLEDRKTSLFFNQIDICKAKEMYEEFQGV